jgi:hypothetical protein
MPAYNDGHEKCTVLVYYATSCDNSLPTFRVNVWVESKNCHYSLRNKSAVLISLATETWNHARKAMFCRPQFKLLYRHSHFYQYSVHSKFSVCQITLAHPHPQTILLNNRIKCWTFTLRCLNGLQSVPIKLCAYFVLSHFSLYTRYDGGWNHRCFSCRGRNASLFYRIKTVPKAHTALYLPCGKEATVWRWLPLSSNVLINNVWTYSPTPDLSSWRGASVKSG